MLTSKMIVLLVAWIAGSASALEIPPEVQTCTACHGANGKGTLIGPMLAGLSEPYINAQMENFIAGRRSNPVMSAVAQGYSDVKLLSQIAVYFSSQGTVPHLHVRGEHIGTTSAEQLYYQGDLLRNLPACYSCHGPSAIGGGLFPRLAGQQLTYLKEQLIAWQLRQRSGDPDNMMRNIAYKLRSDEIDALASYLAGIR